MSIWLQITSGQGPAECQWVVARLLQVILEEAKAADVPCDLVEVAAGDAPGIFRSALLALDGKQAEPFASGWRGTVQWVGRSPYRPHHKRKNWFVGVDLFVPPSAPVWSEADLRIEAVRSSGPGGQHVNKVSSAVRVTHVPTGMTAVAQEERSQHRNRSLALARLAQLFESEGDRRADLASQKRWEQHASLERGNPIRVYAANRFQRKA